ncbi:conjugal transfer protein TrbE [Geomonas paludis]|uniref:Conjugal transfer protein TrbE n=1 Tax=Geomonas paludis TaxID=2740185 RepID=A0ABY4LL51_9BACT|nr:conjugal transfer protein TrbE [Geomonas paludis]UPU37871.1 conjugal transfer protein TrbE [Geomonas paludis]
MFNIGEYRKKPDRLADLLPWGALVAPGVVLNKDGSFQRTFSYRGPDLDSATESELVSVAARVNNVFKRLTAGWAIWAEAQRACAAEYPTSHFDNPLAFLIDEERRASFQGNDHFESAYYLTFLYLPPSEQKSRLAGLFLENSDKASVDATGQLMHFIDETNRIFDLMHGIFPDIHPLDDQETLTYLHGTISPKRHPVRVPEIPMYLDAVLADSPLVGGLEPRLGETPIKVLSVLGYPGQSIPGLLDDLNRLAIEYRWSTRFICMDKTDALSEIAKYKKRWFAKRKSVLVLLKEGITNQESAMSDSDAENKAYDADAAFQELAGDYVSYGYFTANVVIWDRDPERLQAKSRAVEQAINGLGFVTINETLNAIDAWLGSLPGHARANVRRPLLNTLNLAHLMPVSAVWAGPVENKHLQAPVLMHTITSGNTPFRFNLHIGDVGHTMICGPTGAGKDVLMATLQAQFLRYRNSQIYIFDKGGSSRVITAGLGGDFYDLGSTGGDNQLAFQPLSGIDDDRERSWASQWILDVLQQENVTVTPRIKAEVWGTLTSLATTPQEQRTISGFIALSQNQVIRQALFPYSVDGPLGHIFDATCDSLNYSRWQVFEMEALMATSAAVVPALSYLFHRLEQRFSAAVPTLLFLNEAWLFFDSPAFSPRIREWLKTLRKQNVSVIFATQGLTDIESCPISTALIESCPTRIFLPNDRAMEEETARVYRRFGLNERQIHMLAMAQPKRQYYYQSTLGNRLFELGLGPLGLTFCAATSKEDQIQAKKILAGDGHDEFASQWLHHKGLSWAAEVLRSRQEERHV